MGGSTGRVRYRAADGCATVMVLVWTTSTAAAVALQLARSGLPPWLRVGTGAIVVGAAGFAVLWAVRAGTTLAPEHLRITDAVRRRTVRWEAVGALYAGSHVAVLVEGEWVALHGGWDVDAELAVVRSFWVAHRGPAWRAATAVPPLPDEVATATRTRRIVRALTVGPVLLLVALVLLNALA